MKKTHSIFACTNCGYTTNKWLGKCPNCNEWNSLVEEELISNKNITKNHSKNTPVKLNQIEYTIHEKIKTGLEEFDRVVGGGITPGSMILIGGEPGIGKSTLLLEIINKLSKRNQDENFLYVSGEESAAQVASRTKRIGISNNNFYIYNETSWNKVLEEIGNIKPKYLVIDSIQTIGSDEIGSAPGSVSQIKEVTYELMNHVKQKNITCFIVGHITKEGNIAGPKILEHMVDTVIYFEGDQIGEYRIIRAIKNRFGSTNEIGLFQMNENGLIEVKNASRVFLDDSDLSAYGKSLTCTKEGTRSLFLEVQSLVVENNYGNGRRTANGIDGNRVAMMIAILEKYLGIPMGSNDIYVNVIGNLKVGNRDTDLALIASLLSSYKQKRIDDSSVFIGEVGLSGEVRSSLNMEFRLKELEILDYKKVFLSTKTAKEYKSKTNLELIGLSNVKELANYIN